VRTGARAQAALAIAWCLGAPGFAWSQTNERTYESLEFRVVTPGARAVGMGKTFVGIADDATAAASNPAGLSNLFDPELSFEFSGAEVRNTRMSVPVPLQTKTFVSTVREPTFASFVTPLPDRKGIRNVTLAVFYNSFQRYEEHFDLPRMQANDERGYFGDVDISARAFGVSGAVLLGPRLSVGGAITARHLSNKTTSYQYDAVRTEVRNGSETDDSDTRMGGEVGVLFKAPHGVSIGAAYLPGTTFQLTTTLKGVFSPEGGLPARPVNTYLSPTQPIDYRVPDRLTFGGAVRLSPALTVVADLGLVKYSQRVTENFLIVDFLGQPTSSGLSGDQYYYRDVWEVHVGGEYRWATRAGTWAFRAGYFTDPEHQMSFDYDNSKKSPQAQGQAVRFNSYRPGTAHGLTLGSGIVIKNWLQVDAAVSSSANERQVVVSVVTRFPR